MGSCLLTYTKPQSELNDYKVLYPSQGSTIRDGMIRVGGDYEANAVWDMGKTYHALLFYWMHPDNYSTERLYYGVTTSSYTQFASTSSSANTKGSYECTARYIRCQCVVSGSGSVLLSIFALVTEE